jgi:hypothetical protein
MRTLRWLWIVALFAAVACAGNRPPIITPPIEICGDGMDNNGDGQVDENCVPDPGTPPSSCDGRDVVIYTLDGASNPLPNVRIASTAQDTDRISDGNGFSHRWACAPADYAFILEGWHTVNCGDLGASCNLAGPEHRVHLARDALPEPPPGVNADPVQGRIWCESGVCGDDTGPRTFVILHMGDLPLRWHAAQAISDAGERDRYVGEILGDLDAAARQGYHILRSWSHIRPSGGSSVWAHGGSPAYDGLDARHAHFVEWEASLADAVVERGMRLTLETGGIDGLNSDQEFAVMRQFRAVVDRVGAWKFAWASPVNEPSSTHGTSDDNGDVDPTHLRALIRVVVDGTGMLWHLGHASNIVWDTPGDRFAQKLFTPSDQPFGYYHGDRDLHADDKVRRRFTWLYEAPGKWNRFWVDGEGVGAPVCGGSLRCVSATSNGQEMNSPEALSLIVAMQTVRGIGSEMCGNCVQRYQSFENVVGFNQIPWTVRQMHRDVATFTTIHHSGDSWRTFRVLAPPSSGDVRIDGVINSDGRFDYVIHGPRPGTYTMHVDKGFAGKLCDTAAQSCQDVSAPAGGSFTVSFGDVGRLFVGQTR